MLSCPALEREKVSNQAPEPWGTATPENLQRRGEKAPLKWSPVPYRVLLKPDKLKKQKLRGKEDYFVRHSL